MLFFFVCLDKGSWVDWKYWFGVVVSEVDIGWYNLFVDDVGYYWLFDGYCDDWVLFCCECKVYCVD